MVGYYSDSCPTISSRRIKKFSTFQKMFSPRTCCLQAEIIPGWTLSLCVTHAAVGLLVFEKEVANQKFNALKLNKAVKIAPLCASTLLLYLSVPLMI